MVAFEYWSNETDARPTSYCYSQPDAEMPSSETSFSADDAAIYDREDVEWQGICPNPLIAADRSSGTIASRFGNRSDALVLWDSSPQTAPSKYPVGTITGYETSVDLYWARTTTQEMKTEETSIEPRHDIIRESHGQGNIGRSIRNLLRVGSWRLKQPSRPHGTNWRGIRKRRVFTQSPF